MFTNYKGETNFCTCPGEMGYIYFVLYLCMDYTLFLGQPLQIIQEKGPGYHHGHWQRPPFLGEDGPWHWMATGVWITPLIDI